MNLFWIINLACGASRNDWANSPHSRSYKHVKGRKKFYSAVFLDISRAIDKVWHEGLLFKVKKILLHSFYQIIKSYLNKRCFEVKFHKDIFNLFETKSGVPQAGIQGPVLYTIYSADNSQSQQTRRQLQHM